jgi:hypothetical protein
LLFWYRKVVFLIYDFLHPFLVHLTFTV